MHRKPKTIKRMTTPPPIAEQLREAIRASGLSARELAKRADVSNALITRFLNEPGKTLNIDTAAAIAKALGVKITLG